MDRKQVASMLMLLLASNLADPSCSFTPICSHGRNCNVTPLNEKEGDGDAPGVADPMQKARELIAKSKAKIEAKEAEELEALMGGGSKKGNVPFFASKDKGDPDSKKLRVRTSENEEGLATFDGDMMVKLSEEEAWEVRPLTEVFRSELEELDNDPLAKRDVGASIYGLQRSLKIQDFQAIFNKRNRWIGEQ